MGRMKYLTKFKRLFLIALLPFVSYGVLGPLEIFFGNQKDFSFQYTDFVWEFVAVSIIVCLIMSAMLAMLPWKIGRIIGALILGTGVASYLQNMFMNVKLSEIDGSPMRWEELGNFPVINTVIWILIVVVVLTICVLLKEKGDTLSIVVSGFLCAIQLVAVISLLITASSNDNTGTALQISGEDQFIVSPNDNIVVFVLDTFGNTNLERVLETYPDALDGMKDFTFFSNADCHYYCTFPSMTHFLTGEDFDFEMRSQDWMAKAWQSERAVSFWEEMDNADYSCMLFSEMNEYTYGNILNLQDKFDNISPAETIVNKRKLIKLLAKMSVYKYVPYALKPQLEVLTKDFSSVMEYKDGTGIVSDNGEFYQKLIKEKLTIDNEIENAFIIHHLFGIHQPYTLDANANIVNESTVIETMKGLTVIIEEYLKQLRDLGVYDNSTIIITADHGAWYGGDTQPIFFIKRSNETHDDIRINAAPISLDDFQATILDICGKDYSKYGSSIYDWSGGDSRMRTVYMRMNDDAYPAVKGSSLFNVYYKYSYTTDKEELNRKVAEGPEEILPATPW